MMCEVAVPCLNCGGTVEPEDETACVQGDSSIIVWVCRNCGAKVSLVADAPVRLGQLGPRVGSITGLRTGDNGELIAEIEINKPTAKQLGLSSDYVPGGYQFMESTWGEYEQLDQTPVERPQEFSLPTSYVRPRPWFADGL